MENDVGVMRVYIKQYTVRYGCASLHLSVSKEWRREWVGLMIDDHVIVRQQPRTIILRERWRVS